LPRPSGIVGTALPSALTGMRGHGTVTNGFWGNSGAKGLLGACQPESLASHW
jgi:hypothetical protein